MSDLSVEEASLRRVMLRKSRKKYLLCDSSKFDKVYFYDMGDISELDAVISDKPLPESLKTK
jgi:DeoR family glycerol-3-phosphate regulon repressor